MDPNECLRCALWDMGQRDDGAFLANVDEYCRWRSRGGFAATADLLEATLRHEDSLGPAQASRLRRDLANAIPAQEPYIKSV